VPLRGIQNAKCKMLSDQGFEPRLVDYFCRAALEVKRDRSRSSAIGEGPIKLTNSIVGIGANFRSLKPENNIILRHPPIDKFSGDAHFRHILLDPNLALFNIQMQNRTLSNSKLKIKN